MEVIIRKVQQGDANALAYIQTESWKAAFAGILDAETLTKCTNADRATAMYQSLLDAKKGNGYLLLVDENPHCIAYWDAARDVEFTGKAELICIHSLPENWHKGYGRMMMDRVLDDVSKRGYSEVVLWVFTENKRARSFYESEGFHVINKTKSDLNHEEICYLKEIRKAGVTA